jgi:transposase
VRRAEVRTLEEPKGTQRAEEHSVRAAEEPWNLTDIEKTKLTELPKMNKRLYSAYLLKESFAAILDRRQPNVVLMKLEEWISWATHSGLKPFAKVARTITKHLDGIVAYVATGLSNARGEHQR